MTLRITLGLLLSILLSSCGNTNFPLTSDRLIGSWACSFNVDTNIMLRYEEEYRDDSTYLFEGVISFISPKYEGGKAEYELVYDGLWNIDGKKRVSVNYQSSGRYFAIGTEYSEVTEELEFLMSFMPETDTFDVKFMNETEMYQSTPGTSKHKCSRVG